jgi:hypothetical protein
MQNEIKGPLTIVELTAQNVTNLRAVRITPEKNVVVLSGANEAGKSNVLDVIQSLLEGLTLRMPIRQGEERADATLDLGEIKIRKRWTEKGDAIQVYSIRDDGKKDIKSSPQDFLNKLTGKMVDPMKLFLLLRDDPRKFRDVLAKLVGLDLTDLKQEELAIRDERKDVNDRVKAAIAQINVMSEPDPGTPDEEITFRDKLNDLNRLREKKEVFEKAERYIASLNTGIFRRQTRIDEIDRELEALKKEKDSLIYQIKEHEQVRDEKSATLPEKITQEQILAAQADIEKVEDQNKVIRQAIRYRKAVKEAEKARQESDALTTKLERIEQDKQTRIGACKFPVEGLSLTEDQVIFNGKPIEVASSGRQIRIFVKMAMAMSPSIKVLLIRDGSLLDKTGFADICAIAQEEGYQVWFEKTDESGQEGIYIVNGEIDSIDGKKIEKEQGEHSEEESLTPAEK